jgi:hypothetical protein
MKEPDHLCFKQLIKSHSAVNIKLFDPEKPTSSKKFGIHNLDIRRYLNTDGVTTTAFNHVILRNAT